MLLPGPLGAPRNLSGVTEAAQGLCADPQERSYCTGRLPARPGVESVQFLFDLLRDRSIQKTLPHQHLTSPPPSNMRLHDAPHALQVARLAP